MFTVLRAATLPVELPGNSGGRIRTCDHSVMSRICCHCTTPHQCHLLETMRPLLIAPCINSLNATVKLFIDSFCIRALKSRHRLLFADSSKKCFSSSVFLDLLMLNNLLIGKTLSILNTEKTFIFLAQSHKARYLRAL